MLKGKRILVCGGTGFIGSALVKALVDAGAIVTSTVNSREPDPRIPGVRYTEADLTARGCWNTAINCAEPEMVYMVAGKTGGSGLDPMHFVTDNALMALQMFRSCKEFGIKKIIAMSSTTGYPDIQRPVKEWEYFMGDVHPAYYNPGNTRRFIEHLGIMYEKHIDTTFVRCAGAYGPGDDFDPKSSHVIAASVRKVAEKQDPLVVWGDGQTVREAVYISDLVDALLFLYAQPPGAYNVGWGEGMSVDTILKTLLYSARHFPKITYDLTKPQMIRSRILDPTKMQLLGWYPAVPMITGLRMTLNWYLSGGKNESS